MPFKKLYLELTDACNLNCEMCYRKTWGSQSGHMPKEVILKLVDEIKKSPEIHEIVLGGIGEPTIHPDFEWLLNELENYKVTVTSNGTTLDAHLAEVLVKTTEKLVVSVDGSQMIYDRIRGFEYDQLMKNLSLLNAAKEKSGKRTPELIIQMVISKENIDNVFAVLEVASQLKASLLVLSNILPVTMADSEFILYTQYDNAEMKQFSNKIRLKALSLGLEIRFTESKLKTERRCSFIEGSALVINSRGEGVPCYRFSHTGTEVVFGRLKTVEKVTYGSMIDRSLNDLWHDAKYVTFREMVKQNRYPSCPDCDLVDGCDYVRSAAADCYGNTPSCADCLWARNLVYCI